MQVNGLRIEGASGIFDRKHFEQGNVTHVMLCPLTDVCVPPIPDDAVYPDAVPGGGGGVGDGSAGGEVVWRRRWVCEACG